MTSMTSVQYKIEGQKTFQEFLNKIEAEIKKASAVESQWVLFPELVTLDMWPVGDSRSERQIISEISRHFDAYVEALKEFSRQYNINIVGGSTPRQIKEEIFNTAIFVNDQGEVHFQNKLTQTPWEKKVNVAQGTKIQTIPTRFGKMVILVCYDIESPQVSHALVELKPELIIIPSMTESPEATRRVRYTAQARAVEHHAYTVVVPAVGEVSKDWIMYGRTLVTPPQYPSYPESIVAGPENQSFSQNFKLNFDKLQKTRQENKFYPAAETLKLEKESNTFNKGSK